MSVVSPLIDGRRKGTSFTRAFQDVAESSRVDSFFEDLFISDAAEKSITSPLFKEALKNPKLLSLLAVTPEREDALMESFNRYFQRHLDDKKLLFQKGKYKRRPVLSEDHIFEQKNAQDHLSNIRLSNRSQKRKIKNYYGNPFNKPLVEKDSGSLYISRITRCWKFLDDNDLLAFDEQGIQTSLGREHKVILLGTYDDVIAKISETFKKRDDDEVALGIRHIIKGNNEKLTHFNEQEKLVLAALSYLFLGCECTRNPAVFITNQMILDLLINSQISWGEARELMTMAPEGSVGLARGLGKKYKTKVIFPYEYPGKIDSAGALFERDAKLVKMWLKYFYTKDKKKKTTIDKFIRSQIKDWYGFDLEFTVVSEAIEDGVNGSNPTQDPEVQQNPKSDYNLNIETIFSSAEKPQKRLQKSSSRTVEGDIETKEKYVVALHKIQKFHFNGDTNPELGLYGEYMSCPTVGDGDCFFHSIFTQDGENLETVTERAAAMRTVFCEAIQGEDGYINDCRNLVYEDYLEFSTSLRENIVPTLIRNMLRKNHQHEEARNYVQSILKQGDVLPPILTLPYYYDQNTIKAEITDTVVKSYMERFRKNANLDSYISIRPDMICPAELLARQNNVRVNVFIFNKDSGFIQLLKAIGEIDETNLIYNILIDGMHYVALFNPSEGETREKSVKQIIKNQATYAIKTSESTVSID